MFCIILMACLVHRIVSVHPSFCCRADSPCVFLSVCLLELLQYYRRLKAIGGAEREQLDACVCLEACGTIRHVVFL